jgi:hypothetical protein
VHRWVGRLLLVLAIVIVPASVIVTELLYRFGSETTEGVLLAKRPAFWDIRVEVHFITAAGDEIVILKPANPLPARVDDHVLVRYVSALPWLFNSIEDQYDLGPIALAGFVAFWS